MKKLMVPRILLANPKHIRDMYEINQLLSGLTMISDRIIKEEISSILNYLNANSIDKRNIFILNNWLYKVTK